MLRLWKTAHNHEDLFIERYERLLGWSLKLTANDRQLAEDLLHDVFVQFTLRRPDLNTINDLESYLFAMLRNSHVSYVRRAPYVRTASLSMAEYDSLEIGLRAADLRDQIKVQDELRLICHYAVLRKETSKAGSVLILRFFHGYYPSEIAQVLRSHVETVRKWLQLARNEAKLYLDDPNALAFMREPLVHAHLKMGFARTSEELMNDLRDLIFSSRKNDCLSTKQLRELYSSEHTIDGPTLGHLVSCAQCLDAVNALLGLPRLQDRFPTDMTGNDMSGGSGGPPIGPTAFGGGRKRGIKRSMRRLKETFEHYPKELRIAVNGYVQVSQKVSSDRMEQTLSLDLDEKVGFVEIFSEQWIRLFFLEVEPPPEGSFEHQAHVDLSEGRSLKANLDFTGPCPHLQVVYHDPAQSAESAAESIELEKVQSSMSNVQPSSGERLSFVQRVQAIRGWLAQRSKNIGHWTLDLGLLARPSIVTAFVALLITAALFFNGPWSPSISLTASGLLAQSMKAEETMAARADQVLHRTINLEERNLGGEVVARQRIEIWQSGEKGVTARRLYDERGTLVAGDWRTADGMQTLYHHAAKPQLQVRNPQSAIRKSDVWQLDPSAKDFTALVDDTQSAQVQETAEAYVITYARSDLGEQSLAKATLTLSKSDLHATELKLILRSQSADTKSSDFNPRSAIGNLQWTDFRLVETRFERRPIDAVAPAVFEPDPELVASVEPSKTLNLETPAAATQPPMPVMATAALEVEIVEALNNAGAFMGEQISVERADDGKIQVSALVETTERKKELLAALGKVKNNPAVRIGIETVAEAEARVKSRPSRIDQPTQPPTVERIEITEGKSPVFADLKKRFTDEEARLFSERVLRRSRQLWRQASAMKQLSQRFSQSDLQTLTDSERGRWLRLIRGHADSFVCEAESLRRELSHVFPEANINPLSVGIVGGDAELQATVRELYDECVTIDRGMDRSFGVGASGSAPLKSFQFWASFARALGIARSLEAVK